MDQEIDNVLDLKGSPGKESSLAKRERAFLKRTSAKKPFKNIDSQRRTPVNLKYRAKENYKNFSNTRITAPSNKKEVGGKDAEADFIDQEGSLPNRELEGRNQKIKNKRGLSALRSSLQAGAQRIGLGTAFLMVGLAIFYDTLQALFSLLDLIIPLLGSTINIMFINVFAWLSFYTWFKIKGVSFSSPKRILTLNGGMALEMIPFLNALPAWTLAVVILIGTTKIEDAVKDRLERKVSRK